MKRTLSFPLPIILTGGSSPVPGRPALRQGRSSIEVSLGLWMQASATRQSTAGNLTVTANGPSGSPSGTSSATGVCLA
jgi:hypothetical protein